MAKFQVSQETQDKVAAFEQSDANFKNAWAVFEQRLEQELALLDKVREDRNAKLDEARRALRAEAQELSITHCKVVKAGPFSVLKKWSSFYIPEKFVAMLKDRGLYDAAVSAKVVAEKIEVGKFEAVKAFLTNEGVAQDFEECEDGCELTPAVSGPKPIPPFGSELKESK